MKSQTCMGGFWAFCITRSTGLSKGYRIKFWNCPFNGDKYPAADGEKGVSDKDYR